MSFVKKTLRLFDRAAWQAFLRSRTDKLVASYLRKKVEAYYRKQGPISLSKGSRTILADGMWDNPNHFFRLRLFLQALPNIEEYRLLGVIRYQNDRTRKTLEAFGFRDFVCIEESRYKTSSYLSQARILLEQVESHEDLINLELPFGLPAYTYYDTVLKYARDPQPPIDSKLWLEVLAETLRDIDIFEEVMRNNDVEQVVLSHPWKIEFSTLMWAALRRKITSYHLTGFCESIRVRKLCNTSDYYMPVECLPYEQYIDLPANVRRQLAFAGAKYLAERQTGDASDINTRHSFRPDIRIETRTEARKALGGQQDRPLVIIYAHAWFDFPHTYGMLNFTDFLDWVKFTIGRISTINTVDWVLKPHPLEQWYGGVELKNIAGALPSHVRLSPAHVDSQTLIKAADAIVTVHGTVGLEAAAQGVRVIAADQSYYSDWGFVHVASSREHYADLLASVVQLSAPTETQQNDALSCLYLMLAPTPKQVASINLRCDSSGSILYQDIVDLFGSRAVDVDAERKNLYTWVISDFMSYAACLKIDCLSALPERDME